MQHSSYSGVTRKISLLGYFELRLVLVNEFQFYKLLLVVNQIEAVVNLIVLNLLSSVFELKLANFVLVKSEQHCSGKFCLIHKSQTHQLVITSFADLGKVNWLTWTSLHSFCIHGCAWRNHWWVNEIWLVHVKNKNSIIQLQDEHHLDIFHHVSDKYTSNLHFLLGHSTRV